MVHGGHHDDQSNSTCTQNAGQRGSPDGSSNDARLDEEPEPPDSTAPAGLSRTSTQSTQSPFEADPWQGNVVVHPVNKQPADAPTFSTPSGQQCLPAVLQPHSLTAKECIALFKTDVINGLDKDEAILRLEANGPNSIKEAKAVSIWTIFVRQVANALTIILLAAMALSFGVRDYIEGGVVCAVITLNVIIGFLQEYKAEHSLASLRSLSSPTSTVVRSGQIQDIPARNIVVGDIVVFKVGDMLPADIRLLSATNLEIDEASLTGESLPVLKVIEPIKDEDGRLAPADRVNIAFAGTTVTKGRAKGVVIAIGMATQIGVIAEQLNRSKKEIPSASLSRIQHLWEPIARFLGLRDGTPLQRNLAKFALILLGMAIVCAVIVFGVAEFDLTDDVVLYAIALAIGVLPESLIAVLTITFSVGAKRMAKSNVVVRKLDALEALGGVTDICSDKTGTLTHGKMIVSRIWLSDGNQTWNVEQGGASVLEPKGAIQREGFVSADEQDGPRRLALASSLCNVADVYQDDKKQWIARGDPTEVALQVFALKMDMNRDLLTRDRYTLEQEHPFDSATKRMTMVYSSNIDTEAVVLFMKGAPERVLDCCTTYKAANSSTSSLATYLDDESRTRILAETAKLACQGLRVLAFAQRRIQRRATNNGSSSSLGGPRLEAEQDFEFVGLCGLHDPPRAETLEAVRTCQAACIEVHMLTGDHISTARVIARQVGILDGTEPPSAVISAGDFDAMSDEDIDRLPLLPLVIARCSPTTKVRMVAAGKRRGKFIAMTGDGINDAPALLHAPIGIAMGSGTDVAKDGAELILTDDDFDNIPRAVKEGRTIFKNIQRFMIALLVLNVAEVMLLLIGLALRDGNEESLFPISPIGVLFLNLVAGLPAIGLGFEVAERDVMTRPPHDLAAGVLSKQVLWDLFVYGFTMGWTCLLVFVVMIFAIGQGSLGLDCNHAGTGCETVYEARSATFCALFLQGLFVTWHLISIEESILRVHPIRHFKENPLLFWSVIFGLACIPLCIYPPVWSTDVFRQGSLGGKGWGVALAANAIFWLTIEAWKYYARRGAWPWLTRFTGGGVYKRPLQKEKVGSGA